MSTRSRLVGDKESHGYKMLILINISMKILGISVFLSSCSKYFCVFRYELYIGMYLTTPALSPTGKFNCQRFYSI